MTAVEEIDSRQGRGLARGGVTLRAVLWGLVTAAFVAGWGNLQSIVLHGGSLVKSSYPVALILYFCVWIGINVVLGLVKKSWMFTRTEMMVIFATTWIAGMMPSVGWMG